MTNNRKSNRSSASSSKVEASTSSSSSKSPSTSLSPLSLTTYNINGIHHFLLKNGGVSVAISIRGAQILSWKSDCKELLFTSNKAVFDDQHWVRGGISVCFPHFGRRGTALEQSGFARQRIWFHEKHPPPVLGDFNGKTFVDFMLKPTPEDNLKRIWPHDFEFRIRISLAADGSLTLISRIRNIDSRKFSFSIAHHTYLSVSDIGEVRVEGLETCNYIDNLLQERCFTEQGSALTFESEVDRVYVETDNTVAVLDHQKKRTIRIRKSGYPDIVVWNPWKTKSKAIADFGNDEYNRMVCVDGACVKNPIILRPGEEWTGRLEFSLLLSS